MIIKGKHDERTIAQLQRCIDAEEGAVGVLCADGHLGYSMPIGGVVAYTDHISPSGVGYDIACGNMAVRTDINANSLTTVELNRIADEIQKRVSFGVGRVNNEPVDSPVFDTIDHSPVKEQRGLLTLARNQLGTVGSGNHYVDLLTDEKGLIWIAVHFGSRGFGHKTATGFMNIANNLPFSGKSVNGEMDALPLLLKVDSPAGHDYIDAMDIAGDYAYAGRRAVTNKVLEILGNPEVTFAVHNHHNFAWPEQQAGGMRWVVRKGATPAFPGQYGFVGGSMGDISVILKGVESIESNDLLYSTVHGAGRVMSRTMAAGKKKKVEGLWIQKTAGLVNFDFERKLLDEKGIILRGAGADEAPPVYRSLQSVLDAHKNTIEVVHTLLPLVVVMAGAGTVDPYKD